MYFRTICKYRYNSYADLVDIVLFNEVTCNHATTFPICCFSVRHHQCGWSIPKGEELSAELFSGILVQSTEVSAGN